jgi:hypothetical protein
VFLAVFIVTVVLTVLSIGINVVLVLTGSETTMAKDLAETCATTWKSGSGAVFGMLAGKAL